ncbi:MAG: beta-galactosidase [Ignavibacteria bacterium GWB2_35_6b]|nr:MAG: beta-galactosidase [Ignavibacteria bacterium GWB2_35_6b]
MRINDHFNKYDFNVLKEVVLKSCFVILFCSLVFAQSKITNTANGIRERISINEDWKFYKYESIDKSDNLIYDVRPEISEQDDDKPADSKPTKAEKVNTNHMVLKPWILPTGNDFLKDSSKHFVRPEGNPGIDFPFTQINFDDNSWKNINLPHDWAIEGPFFEGTNPEVGGGMGRLPSHGVAWYRKQLEIPASDSNKFIFLDIDGAMSYSMVWLNGNLVGGWPYGYSSWRLDLTPYIIFGGINQLAIRLDNPNSSSRWYPGGGIYRNVWLTKTNPIYVGQWGTFITTDDVKEESAVINLEVTVDNKSANDEDITIVTQLFELKKDGSKTETPVASFEPREIQISSGNKTKIESFAILKNPKLWGPPPTQVPNLYIAVTTLYKDESPIDQYETRFGIRSLSFDPNAGVYINDELIKLKGVNQHHDLGALGAAFNTRAAERQLEILKEMGCNAIRMAHNPPAPELLELTDKMGFLVIDESFDVWELKKTPLDFHLIFPDWYEQDLRSMLRRDRNSPSVIMWSYGNEVGEQYTHEEGAALSKHLCDIIKEEDTTRPATSAMNWAKPFMPFPAAMDIISLNYQGEGIRQDPMFEGTERIRTSPQYNAHHEKFPDKVILTSESASAASSRGIYLFPVTDEISSPIRDGRGGDSKINHVSSYELYAVDFGSSVDKVFASLDRHPFVAGEFVWNGFDYIGEPTPYYDARSSYTGIIDLAGFKKDRFYLYQSHWRPEFPMAHILPHWNWYERIGEITPVHVFTSGDEAELFLNGKSLGKKKKDKYEYRLRWDEVKYEPGELKVITYKNGKEWVTEIVKTTDVPAQVKLSVDRNKISPDGKDLSFITVSVLDKNGLIVPTADNNIKFKIEGPGEILATDNGDPTDFTPFPSHEREAFNGLALVIIRSKSGDSGLITLTAKSPELQEARVEIKNK